MKNKFLHIFLFLTISHFTFFATNSAEQFNFNVTEIEIYNDGNIIKGFKKGSMETNDGTIITADTFVYNKLSNILNANGNVEIIDPKNDLKIYSDVIIYEKNREIITTNQNSKAIYGDEKIIYANSFIIDRNENILNAKNNVRVVNTLKDYLITGNNFTYFKNTEKIITSGETKGFFKSKYEIISSNVSYLIDENILSSKDKTEIKDENSQVYFLENFNYQINQEILKGEKILIITNYNLPGSDKIFFENAIIDLKEQKFVAKNTEIKIHNSIFNNSENDPRLKGISSVGNGNVTEVRKGIFTSCKKNDDCPPWSIQADKIKHNKAKKQLIYENAVLNIYDLPVLYFPKFFHPDPSVTRQSGLLPQSLNNSNVLGSSLTTPYFKTISENQDLTFVPTWFDSDAKMLSLEYRETNENSNFLADTGLVNNYKSPTTKKNSNLSHLFFKFNKDLRLKNYISSSLSLSYEKVTSDNYLSIFDQYLTKSQVRPENSKKLNNNLKITLDHTDYSFITGFQYYENLNVKKQNDKYSYNLPYYNYSKNIEQNIVGGNFSFNSIGNNYLKNTNQVETNAINNLDYRSLDYVSSFGLKSNFGINFKNLTSIGKNTPKYKSSPQMELLSIYNIDASFPLINDNKKSKNLLTPKLSLRFNPSDMKNYSSSNNIIDVNNVFAINRFGFSDSFESGRSLTLGIDYKKQMKNNSNNIDNINRYFEAKLATVLRDKEEKLVPNKSSLNKTNSNLFGSISSKTSENFKVSYNFSLDNDYNTFEYNKINSTISINNVVADFNFIEADGERGDENIFSTKIGYNFNEKNSLQFQTRRNRRINLTEYYDLVYEYKNDCLTAGIKYKKKYYSDGDLKPSENLMFTITLFPLTTYEYSADELLEQ